MKRIWKPILITLAIVYFLIDLLFLTFVRPLSRALRRLAVMARIQAWIDTLNRYQAMTLFLIPMVTLEPIKPIGFWMMAHHKFWLGLIVIAIGEVVKLTLVERLFHMTKTHLMTFKWFAWCLKKWGEATNYIKSLPVWQKMFRLYWKGRWRQRKFFRKLFSRLRFWPFVVNRENSERRF